MQQASVLLAAEDQAIYPIRVDVYPTCSLLAVEF